MFDEMLEAGKKKLIAEGKEVLEDGKYWDTVDGAETLMSPDGNP